ncbi:MAG: Peptide deformylase 1 [Flavobacteriaceae bacterium]|jgi:peptide deformylase|nr:peptide deformylase [Flavobacteriaceae bacterium]MBL6693179.1 peptide deformylase [Flavobacteriaceae bacterium]CAI8181287.1 MAG: Peptide deformylase 1 [Flavobacteriaceae bacterium]HCZ09442.1 peptide deformylase [Flavobacteriaceae bacterium]|tara:strand:+ start:2576 stop:3163 length:588 start_codon:yes stop_codon:yes gene_type:complete
MILPIVAYGCQVLRTKATAVDQNDPELNSLISNMWETMYEANGVGLAAPQVGVSKRLFVIDAAPFAQDEELSPEEAKVLEGFKKVFINPIMVEEKGSEWEFTEGCLSIPNIREDISRKAQITIQFLDENFNQQTLSLDGLPARVVQHEYDHIEGVLFTDKLSPLKKRLLKRKLSDITKANIKPDYKMRFLNNRVK